MLALAVETLGILPHYDNCYARETQIYSVLKILLDAVNLSKTYLASYK